MPKRLKPAMLLPLATLLLTTTAQARVVRIEAQPPETMPSAPGGATYELVRGLFHGELDPADPANRIITDLDKAPRNARGKVEYSATFAIARPVDPAQRSGLLFYQVPNRGGGVQLQAHNDGRLHVMSGWQGDVPRGTAMQYLVAPIAKGPDGSLLKGPVLARMTNIGTQAKSLAFGRVMGQPFPRPEPVSLDMGKARLTLERKGAKPVILPATEWAFADCWDTPFPGKPDRGQICLKAGFNPDAAYTLTYEGKDPPVLATGFAATRDLLSFLRSGKTDDAGNANPAGSGTRWIVGQGNSQSGNFLRSFVHLGFNADEAGARVFDGINPNIAARQLVINLRFSLPGGAAGLYEPGSEGTLWWGRYEDRARKQGVSSLLDRCTQSNTCPKVVDTLGSAEFWGLRASPGFVGTDAKADIPLPPNVRRYYFPSVTHGGSRTGGFNPEGEQGGYSNFGCTLPGNPASVREPMAVAIKALIDWVKDGKEPPASRQPSLSGGDLVLPTAQAIGWPSIPGAPSPTGKINPFWDYGFGGGFIRRDVSGHMEVQPPALRRAWPQLVPRVDRDGNEMAGIRPIQLRVPLGTYTGWNVQAQGFDAGGGCGFAGGFIPFARTKAEREARGDPRRSLEERYGNNAGFVKAAQMAIAEMEQEGWLLPEDAARLAREAEASPVLK